MESLLSLIANAINFQLREVTCTNWFCKQGPLFPIPLPQELMQHHRLLSWITAARSPLHLGLGMLCCWPCSSSGLCLPRNTMDALPACLLRDVIQEALGVAVIGIDEGQFVS